MTFGCNEPTGLDWLSYFWERAVADSQFRAYLPPPDSPEGEAALARHLAMLADRLKAMALDPQSLAATKAFQRGFWVGRNPYDLPNL